MQYTRYLIREVSLKMRDAAVQKSRMVLAACSGGKDSIALAYVLFQAGWKNIIVAHVEHGIRTPQSQRQEYNTVSALAKRLRVPILHQSAEIHMLQVQQHKESLEAAARRSRYRVLHEMAHEAQIRYAEISSNIGREGRCQNTEKGLESSDIHESREQIPIVMAHHLCDQAETVAMRIFSNKMGLLSLTIPDKRAWHDTLIIRPALHIHRRYLHEVIRENALPYFQDESNMDDRFLRNAVRMHLMPSLTSVFPSAVNALSRLGKSLDLLKSDMWDLLSEKQRGTVQNGKWSIQTKEWCRLPLSAREIVLRKAVYGVASHTRVNMGMFRCFLHSVPKSQEIAGQGICLKVNSDKIELRTAIARSRNKEYLIKVDKPMRIIYMKTGEIQVQPFSCLSVSQEISPVDGSLCTGGFLKGITPPLIIRKEKRGDYIVIHGRKKTLCTEAARMPVLEDVNGIAVWMTSSIIMRDGVEYVSLQQSDCSEAVAIQYKGKKKYGKKYTAATK